MPFEYHRTRDFYYGAEEPAGIECRENISVICKHEVLFLFGKNVIPLLKMPKRPRPFDEVDLPPQLKMHVGQKQVDLGVSSEERMKEVYDKTMDLLKEGVKTLSKKLNESIDLDPQDILLSNDTVATKHKTQRTLKQMVLNSKLELETADKAVNGGQARYDLCGCSRVIDEACLNKCSYCDQILCSSCLYECSKCSEMFCQNCSLPVYDTAERAKCLNCY